MIKNLFEFRRHIKLVFCPFFLLCITLICGCVNAKNATKTPNNKIDSIWMFTDSTVMKQLGDSLIQVFSKPDSVRCYNVSYREQIKEKDVIVHEHFVRDSLITVLNDAQIYIMQFILVSESSNYANDSLIVKSPYMPTVEFEFYKKDFSPISVVFSPLNQTWQIICESKELFSYNFVYTDLINRYISIFNKP